MNLRALVAAVIAFALVPFTVVSAVADGTQPPPATAHPSYGAVHEIDVAVNDNPSSGYAQITNDQVNALMQEVSDYWVSNTGGLIGGIHVRTIVRYSTVLPCNSASLAFADEAAQQVGIHEHAWAYYTSEGTALPEHLLMLGECTAASGAASASVTGVDNGGWIVARASLFTPVSCQLDCGQVAAIAHEFGHNLGLKHANSTTFSGCALTAAPNTEITECAMASYGDRFSVMGFATPYTTPRLDIARRDQLGALTANQMLTLEGTTAGTFVLAPVGPEDTLQGLRVVSGSGTVYYVEYRSATSEPGTWGNRFASYGYTPRVRIVRAYPDWLTQYTATRTSYDTAPDSGLPADSQFTSADGTVRITTGTLGDTATVTVTTGPLPTLATVLPTTITGTAEVGATLTANPPVTTPASTAIAFQWFADGATIPEATNNTYVVPATMYARTLTVLVTVTASGHQNLASTSEGVVIAAGGDTVSLTPPSLSGPARVGVALTPTVGQWAPGVTLAYQWLRNGTTITGATGWSYTPVATDVGARVSVAVTGKHPQLGSVTVTTSQLTVTAGLLTSSTPTIAGSAVPGKTLTVKPGTWTTGTTRTYQWYANGAAIRGATKTTFKVTSAQLGKKITVAVTGKKAGYTTVVKTSAMKGVLKPATPKISGTVKVGRTLTAKPGAWTSGTTFTYQWYANGAAIRGATAKTFKVKTAQRGKRITVKVTGKKSGYTTVAKMSAKTKKAAK